MGWEKLGRIFSCEGQYPWALSHASVPFAEPIDSDIYRIYFTSRDAKNRSHIGWIEVDLARPNQILRISTRPLLAPGPLGTFDDSGAMMSWLVTNNHQRYLYYVGWNIRSTVPFHVSIGLAVANEHADDLAFTTRSGPVLDRDLIDPYFCSNPCVLLEGGLWRMWYLSGLGWVRLPQGITASYDVRYAESVDGIEWRRTGQVAIGLSGDELAIARPCVVRESSGYSMWYSVRARDGRYRLGVARSEDGLIWQRDRNDAGLALSSDGWDSEMIAYPHVFDHGSDRYMLYCGNGFGRTGFGLAVAT